MSLACVYLHRIKLLDNLFSGYVGPAFAIAFPCGVGIRWRAGSRYSR